MSEILVNTIKKADGTGSLTVPAETGTVLTSASVLESLSIQGTLSDDTQTTPETLLTIGASYNSIGANGGAGAGTRIELQVPDDETNPTTGAAIGSIKTSADDSDSSSGLAFYTSNNDTTLDEAMRIESDGDVAMGTTTTGPRLAISDSRTNNYAVKINCSRGGGETGFLVQFTENTPAFSNSVGSIRSNGSSVSYLTTSDYRLKENVVDMTGAIARVKSLSPKRFNFIADTDDTVVDGFLAHETQSVVPEAVSGTHNEVDADGNPDYQGIDQSKLVPLLTGALKEAIAKIETLETTVADLQTRVTALEGA